MKTHRILAVYTRLLRWYPRSYKETYREEMVALLQDQLRDAERLGDDHIRREIILRAFLELPLTILAEHLRPGREPNMPRALSWKRYSTVFILLVMVSEVSVLLAYPLPFTFLLTVCSALSIIWATFADTRRTWLAFLVLLLEVVAYVVMSTVVASLRIGTVRGAIVSDPFFDPVVQFNLALVVPLLLGYALATLYHRFPARFHRASLSRLLENETEELRLHTQLRRQRNFRIAAGIVIVILGMNIVGLYDPPQSHADLDLSTVSLADSENMAREIAAMPGGCDGPTSNTDDCAKSLILLHQAAAKSSYQGESMSNPGHFATLSDLAAASITPLGALNQTVTYALQSPTLDTVIDVIHIGDAVQASQGFLIENLFGQTIVGRGIDAATVLRDSGALSPQDSVRLASVISHLHDTRPGLKNGIKAEYLASRLALQSMRTDSESTLYVTSSIIPESPWDAPIQWTTGAVHSLPYRLPWSYQPNRTIGLLSDQVREYLSEVDADCGTAISHQYPTSGLSLGSFWKYNGMGKELVANGYDPSGMISRRCVLETKIGALKHTLPVQ